MGTQNTRMGGDQSEPITVEMCFLSSYSVPARMLLSNVGQIGMER